MAMTMRNVRTRGAVAFVLCLLAFSCTDFGVPPAAVSPTGVLSGLVSDEQGNPLPGVGVHYIFSTVPIGPPAKVNTPAASMIIGFSLAHDGPVTLRLLRWYTRALAKTLIDTIMTAGNYRIAVDPAALTNGVYTAQLTADDTVKEFPVMMLNTDPVSLSATPPLVTTDSHGRFSLADGVFAFGVPLHLTNGAGYPVGTYVISRAIQLVLFRNGYQILLEPMVVDTTRSIDGAFILKK